MANRTVGYAVSIHGTNPQYLIEKIIRTRIYDCKYWKEHCLLLNSARVLERAVDDLKFVGGVHGGHIKPTPFLCLTLKLLQIQPQKEIIYLFIEQPDFKYLRMLGAFYLRLVGTSVEIYTKLEPLFNDYRKLRLMNKNNEFSVIHVDEMIDNLLREERFLDVILPRLTRRSILEENGELGPYRSELEDLNLLPTQVIEEKVEEALRKARHKDITPPRERVHPSSKRYNDDTHADYDRGHDRRRDDHKYQETQNYRSLRYDDRRRQIRRSRSHSRSPEERRAYPRPGSSNRHQKLGRSRFKQEEIDEFNSIRAKLGLKPLH